MKLLKIIIIMIIPVALLVADNDNLELGKRYIKLGNTYRESGNYGSAGNYLKKGISLLEKQNSWEAKYWQGVAHEFYGYFYRDMNMQTESVNEFQKAYDIYEKLISMQGGSDEAVAEIKANMKTLKNKMTNKKVSAGDRNILSYDDMNLRSVPGNIPRNIENLSLRDNKLRDFDYILMELSELKYLDLSKNKIRELPNAEQLQKLNNLLWLDLSDNKLKRADLSGLCALTNLGVLDISNNDIDFNQIKNLIQCLPNTRIIHDEYELKEE